MVEHVVKEGTHASNYLARKLQVHMRSNTFSKNTFSSSFEFETYGIVHLKQYEYCEKVQFFII